MTCIEKILLAFVIVQVALVLAKPYEPEEDGLFHSNDRMKDYLFKRASGCVGGCEPEGCYTRTCRSSCKSGEFHVSIFDKGCGGKKCCMCRGWC